MDAVQFGRWLSEQRRKSGWRSQRSLVDTARLDPLLSESGISEDFIARLEAGQLAHPFRGSVRQRVLVLAWLLCKTPGDMRAYLHAAEINDLSASETEHLNRLSDRLVTRRTCPELPLPPRPERLLGRETVLHELTTTLCTRESGLCVITGMPGVGKSALAYEAVHLVAANDFKRLHLFPDGIATFTCTGRRGVSGLIALLNDIITVFSPPSPKPARKSRHNRHLDTGCSQVTRSSGVPALYTGSGGVPGGTDTDLADVTNRARRVLANKCVLLLLDDLDTHFPLRMALEAMLAHDRNPLNGNGAKGTGQSHRLILATSRYVPTPSLVSYHLPLQPLEPAPALELFTSLLGCSLNYEEYAYAEQICAAVGYLPLAIEIAATAVAVQGIPLALLAPHVTEHPLDIVLDSEGELRSRLAQAFEAFDLQIHQQFALLSTLGTRSFGLGSAAAIDTADIYTKSDDACLTSNKDRLNTSGNTTRVLIVHEYNAETHSDSEIAQERLVHMAANLGLLARHSLVELIPCDSSAAPAARIQNAHSNGMRYRLHPLLYAHAKDQLHALAPEMVNTAHRNIQAYALAYIENCRGDRFGLEYEREFLLAALKHAWGREEYIPVVRFVRGLSGIIDRLNIHKTGEHILRWGIYAAGQVNDRYQQARFLNHLGMRLGHRMEFVQAQGVWDESLQIAEALSKSTHSAVGPLWYPLANAAHLAISLGEYDAAQRFSELYLQRSHSWGEKQGVASALFLQGILARTRGDLDKAYTALSESVNLLSGGSAPLARESFFELQIQAEFARVQGDYVQSKECTETAVSLFQGAIETCTAEALFDQAQYANEAGMYNDALAMSRRVVAMAAQVGSSHLDMRCRKLLQQIPGC